MKIILRIVKFIKNHPLGGNKFFYSLYKFLFLQMFFRITNKGFLVNWIEKSKFMLYKGDSGLSGNFQREFKVYQRENLNCLKKKCNGKIKKIFMSNRSTFFCNICQK